MSDSISINALIAGQHNAGVIDSLANPPQVNVLGSISRATEAAQGVMRMRALQSQQAWGEALQQATDPNTGTVDYPKATALAAKDPRMPMGMAAATEGASGRSGEQLTQSITRHAFVGNLALDGMRDPSDANWAQIRAKAVAAGLPPSGIAEIDRIIALPPEQRKVEAFKHAASRMDATYNLAVGGLPVPSKEDLGPGIGGVAVTPPSPGAPGGVAATGGFVPKGPDPATSWQLQPSVMPVDAAGNPTTPDKAVKWQSVTIPRGSLPAPANAGQPPAAAPAPGTVPIPTTPGVPPGRITAPNPALANPNKTAPVPTAPAPPPAATPPAPQPGIVGGAVIAGPPQGQPEKLKADVEAFTNDQATIPVQLTAAQNLAHAYDALTMLKSATGKGAQGINDLRSFAQTLGILPQGAVNEQTLYEIIHKYTERAMIDAAGGSTTDMGRRMQEQANAGTLLSTPANLEIMRNDMGKKLQAVAAYKDHMANGDPTGPGYMKRRADVADSTDPRGFVWNLYGPDEQKKIQAEVAAADKAAGDTVASDKLHRAIGMAKVLKLQIPSPVPAPPAVKQQSQLQLPPAPNALAMGQG